jgi:hypothetical protein
MMTVLTYCDFLRGSLRGWMRIAAIGAALCNSAAARESPKFLTLTDCVRPAEAAPNAISLAQQESRIAGREIAQARAIDLTGTVLDQDVAALGGAQVTLKGGEPSGSLTTTTDASGAFRFEKLNAGA